MWSRLTSCGRRSRTNIAVAQNDSAPPHPETMLEHLEVMTAEANHIQSLADKIKKASNPYTCCASDQNIDALTADLAENSMQFSQRIQTFREVLASQTNANTQVAANTQIAR